MTQCGQPRSITTEALEAIVLVGGKGSRLQSVVSERPKPLALVAGRPFLEWLLLALWTQGLRRVILCTGHRAEAIEGHFGSRAFWGMEIVYSREPAPLGTAGALRHALSQVNSDRFLALNGDSYCHVDIGRLLAFHQSHGAQATLWLAEVDDCGRYGSIELAGDGAVLAFREKSPELRPGLINAGVYLLERVAVETIPMGRASSLETEFFPGLIGRGLYATPGDGPFVDIGVPESYHLAGQVLESELNMLESLAREAQLQRVHQHLNANANLMQQVAAECGPTILAAAESLVLAFRTGHKVLLCGNGGSAADCQHVAAELVSRLNKDFDRPALPAIALTTDTSILTAYANDSGFEGVFERQVQALGNAGDVLIGISTSGNSRNVIRALETAHSAEMHTIALTGQGGQLSELAQIAIVVPHADTQHIQEAHLTIEHIVCDLVERMLFQYPSRDESRGLA